MKARLLGGILYFIVFMFAVFTDFYHILFPIFLIRGLYEIARMQVDADDKSFVLSYTILFSLGVFSLYYITHLNPGLVFYVSLLIMLNDTMAFFVGKTFGRHKLSRVSPNKTIEGSIGGIFFGILFSYIIIWLISQLQPIFSFGFIHEIANATSNFNSIYEFLIISICITVFGQLGDLLESKLKRTCDQKDSGTIIYGHGGVLDRIDSLVIAMLFMALYLS